MHHTARARAKRLVKAGLLNQLQSRQTAGCGNRVAAQSAGLIHRPKRREHAHHFFARAKRCEWHAAANHFTEHRHVRHDAKHLLRAAECHTKARHHLIKGQERAILRAQLAATLGKSLRRADKVHVARNRFNHQASHLVAMQSEGFFELGNVVEFQHQRVLHHLWRHAGAGGVAEGRQARASFHKQRICVAVVTAFKFDDLAAACSASREANRAHAGLCTRRYKAHHFHAGHEAQDFFGQFDFAFSGRTE